MKIKSSLRGFTLIELLVAIAIISALSALLLPNFMAARERARDSQRKSDLKAMQSALELYKLSQATPAYPNSLPTANTCWYIAGGTAGTVANPTPCPTGSTVLINKVPADPKTLTPTPYYYTVGSNVDYTLCTCLENKADPDGVTGDCGGSYTCGTGGKHYQVTQP